MVQKNKYLVSIIWGYSKRMYDFAIEENYHLHVLNIAKELGYIPVVIIKQEKGDIENDPNFDKNIKIINYKNLFNYFFQIIKYSFKNSIFYVNSVEPQSLCIPFLARNTIFMGHTHPVRQTKFRQIIFNFSMKYFDKIRLNNTDEKQFLLNQGIDKNKLKVVPLAISNRIYQFNNNYKHRKDIVYFGNVTLKKNLKTILKAFKIVLEEDKNLKLHIIGATLDSNSQKLLINLNIINNVIIHGFISLKELSIILNNFKIYINSSYDEGQCVAVYNASLSGCALCLPNIMSFRGVFKNKALFHEVNDYKKLAENIIFYLDNPQIASEYNKLCREMIIKNYNYQKISEDMKELFTF